MKPARNHTTALSGTRLVCALVASMVSLTLGHALAATPLGDSDGARPAARPSLVVGIFVEGLTADDVSLLRHNFGDGGLNWLIDHGVTLRQVDYGTGLDATAATAMLVSGAAPAVNGVPSARVWDTATRRQYPVLLAKELAGGWNDIQLTPAPLKVSTLSDEIRVADGGLGQVHALAADPQVAILLAGHAGNSAHWLSTDNGKWTQSGAYRDTPAPISRRNVGLTLASRLDTMAWEPAVALDRYPDLPSYKKIYPFRYTFPRREPDRFKLFNLSPLANREIASAAAECITVQSLGSKGVTDMISVGLNVSPWMHGRDADNRLEAMDAVVRLDRDIAAIIDAVRRGPGLDRTLLFVAGTPAPGGSRRDDDKWGIPTGRFSPRSAVSLLNMYLMAIHGPGEWVSGYHNGYFFLNRDLIKERGLADADMRRESAEFLTRMAGVSDVYTLDDILARRAGDDPVALRRNISAPLAGDLLVRVNPGWEISDGDESAQGTQDGAQLSVVRSQAVTSPVYIYAPSLQPAELAQPVDARAVAPTVARLLRIRSPNAASLRPVL